MRRTVWHLILVPLSIAAGFLVSHTDLAGYDLQLMALAFLVYFFAKRVFSAQGRIAEAVTFGFVITLVVATTGYLQSPFYFLIYFLLFSLSLLLEPASAIVATFSFIVFFLFSMPTGQSVNDLIPLFSLAFLTPFALYLGQEYIEIRKTRTRARQLETNLANQEEQTYLFLSLTLKNHLRSIMEAADNFIGDHQLHQIKKHTREMERMIDKFEKEP